MTPEEQQRAERLEQIVRDEGEDLGTRLTALAELNRRIPTRDPPTGWQSAAYSLVSLAVTCESLAIGTMVVELLNERIAGRYASGGPTSTDEECYFLPIVEDPTTQLVVRLAALEQIRTPNHLVAIALLTQAPEVGVRMIERLLAESTTPRARLAQIAEEASHLHVRLFAHALLAEDDGK